MLSQIGTTRRWFLFTTVAIGVFLSTMDSSMINVALPGIMRSFNTTLAMTEWVVLIYLLTITISLLFWGSVADHLGVCRLYLLGMLIFTFGSALCYLAPDLTLLVAFRFVQATGAAMMMSTGPAIIKMVFPVDQLGRSLGLIGIATSAGLMCGPVISGFLIHSLSWRAIFLVTVPVSLLFFVFGWFFLLPSFPAPSRRSEKQFDWLGFFLWSVLVTAAVYFSTHYAMSNWWMKAGGGLLFIFMLALFFSCQKRAQQPLIPFHLLKDRYFSSAMLSSALSFMVLFIVLILTPFYLDYVLHLSVDRIGSIMMSLPVAVFIVSPMSGRLYDAIGARVLTTLGLGICCLDLCFITTLSQDSTSVDVVWRLALLGVGQAMFLAPNTASVLARVDSKHIGITSGMLATSRNLGMLAGVAVAGLVFGVAFSWFSNGFDLKDFQPHHTSAFMQAMKVTFGGAVLLAVAGVVSSWFREEKAG